MQYSTEHVPIVEQESSKASESRTVSPIRNKSHFSVHSAESKSSTIPERSHKGDNTSRSVVQVDGGSNGYLDLLAVALIFVLDSLPLRGWR